MNTDKVNKKQISLVMWNIQNLSRHGFLPNKGQGDDKLRFMLRSALSIDGDSNLLQDVLIALVETTKIADDDYLNQLFCGQTVDRLLKLLQRYAVAGCSSKFELQQIMMILGSMASAAGIVEGMKQFFESNGLSIFNLILQSDDIHILREALWVLTNIACDSEEAAYQVLQSDLFSRTLELMERHQIEVKKEAHHVVGNVLTCLKPVYLLETLKIYDQLLRSYLQGLNLISNP